MRTNNHATHFAASIHTPAIYFLPAQSRCQVRGHRARSAAPQRVPGISSAFPKMPNLKPQDPVCPPHEPGLNCGVSRPRSPSLDGLTFSQSPSLLLYGPANPSSDTSIHDQFQTFPIPEPPQPSQSRREKGETTPRRLGRTQWMMLSCSHTPLFAKCSSET